MKKKVVIVALVCVLLFGGVIMSCYSVETYFGIISPYPYTIYINNEKVEDVCAYWYQGHMYVPVLGIMELCGYKVNRVQGEDPYVEIDGEVYQLNMEKSVLINGKKEYLRDHIGVRWSIDIDDDDSYVVFAEIKSFFERIGKEQQIQGNDRNYLTRSVSFEINNDS